jgi:hypothetical protein
MPVRGSWEGNNNVSRQAVESGVGQCAHGETETGGKRLSSIEREGERGRERERERERAISDTVALRLSVKHKHD